MPNIRKLTERDIQEASERASVLVDGPEPGYVETPSARQICRGIDYVKQTPCIGVFIGQPGTGKTVAGKHFVEASPGLAVFVNLHAVSTTAGMLLAIANRISSRAAYGAYRNYTMLEELGRDIAPGSVLVLDEVQGLNAVALDVVRYFLDELNVGVALLGNEVVWNRIGGQHRRAVFAQLQSRVGIRVLLPRPTDEDADALLTAWGVSDPAAREYARQIARGPGALRQMIQLIRQARRAAIAAKRPLDQRILAAAAKGLGLST